MTIYRYLFSICVKIFLEIEMPGSETRGGQELNRMVDKGV
jgi:hypothetical protein